MSGPYWDAQWNMISGCTEASEGCANCWTKRWHDRFEKRPFSEIHLRCDKLRLPLRWRRAKTVFVSNTSDLFHPEVPAEFIVDVFATMLVSSLHTLHFGHTFLICTKRAERMRDVVNAMTADELATAAGRMMEDSDGWHDSVYSWVKEHGPVHPLIWAGITAENQKRLDERAPFLFETKAARRWLSLEPLLGPITALKWLKDPCNCNVPVFDGAGQHSPCCQTFKQPWGIDQLVSGGESGPKARPCDVEWLRKLKGEARETSTPYFLKQYGSDPYQRTVFVEDKEDGFKHHFAGGVRMILKSRHGSDPSEWAPDMRVRELAWPKKGDTL